MKARSKRPYLLRALYDWMVDSELTPQILVAASDDSVIVPQRHVDDGRIVLNIGPGAVRDLCIEDGAVSFDARFSGNAFAVYVPMAKVLAIYARETGEGAMFEEEEHDAALSRDPGVVEDDASRKGPHLTIIK